METLNNTVKLSLFQGSLNVLEILGLLSKMLTAGKQDKYPRRF